MLVQILKQLKIYVILVKGLTIVFDTTVVIPDSRVGFLVGVLEGVLVGVLVGAGVVGFPVGAFVGASVGGFVPQKVYYTKRLKL